MLIRKFAITAAAAIVVGAPVAAHASPADCSKLRALLQAGGGVSEGPGWIAQCESFAPTPTPDPGTQIAGGNDPLFPNYPDFVPPQRPITPVIPQNTPEQQPWEPSQYPGGPRLNPPRNPTG